MMGTGTIEESWWTFRVHDGPLSLELEACTFAAQDLAPPGTSVVFTSGFTGGVAMYGRLVGHALAHRGHRVTTYDVAGFFTNRDARGKDRHVTEVDPEHQEQELLALIERTRERDGVTPALVSWAMGATVAIGAVCTLAHAGGPVLPLVVPMNYTRMTALQRLREDPVRAHLDLVALDGSVGVAPFDVGTEATRLGFYPLDPQTQAYVDAQLGDYTEDAGVDRWPGCALVSARSYVRAVAYDPEGRLDPGIGTFPEVLIVHGADNTLHDPQESVRLHDRWPGPKDDRAFLVAGMQHGQQMTAGDPVFEGLMDAIDARLRRACVPPTAETAKPESAA